MRFSLDSRAFFKPRGFLLRNFANFASGSFFFGFKFLTIEAFNSKRNRIGGGI